MVLNSNKMKHNKQLRTLKKVRAFTLIEVMLALAIFSIAGVALIGSTNAALSNTRLLENKMYAGWVASNQLVEMKLENQWPPKNNHKGDVELAGQKWYWQQKVIKTTDDNLKAVVIEVSKNDTINSGQAIANQLLTYVANEN